MDQLLPASFVRWACAALPGTCLAPCVLVLGSSVPFGRPSRSACVDQVFYDSAPMCVSMLMPQMMAFWPSALCCSCGALLSHILRLGRALLAFRRLVCWRPVSRLMLPFVSGAPVREDTVLVVWVLGGEVQERKPHSMGPWQQTDVKLPHVYGPCASGETPSNGT